MSAPGTARYDRTLRVVMWMDAFLSAALAVICVIASPVLALFELPRSVVLPLGLAVIGAAVLLAAFGAVTFVVIGRRMATGHYRLPVALRLPLPAAMRPPS